MSDPSLALLVTLCFFVFLATWIPLLDCIQWLARSRTRRRLLRHAHAHRSADAQAGRNAQGGTAQAASLQGHSGSFKVVIGMAILAAAATGTAAHTQQILPTSGASTTTFGSSQTTLSFCA